MAAARRTTAAGRGQLHAGAADWRRSPGDRARRRDRTVLRSAAHREVARRGAAQGKGRSPDLERHRPPLRRGGALGQGAGSPRRDRRLQAIGQADRRLPRIRRRAGVLPRERLRQGVPDADGVARPHRHRELRAVPARHARQDRRLSRHAAHRRLQDRVQHLHRAHLHAGASRDGRVAQRATSTSSWFAASPTDATSQRRTSAALSITARSCPRTPSGPGWWTMSRTKTSWTTRCKLANGTREFVDRRRLPPHQRRRRSA